MHEREFGQHPAENIGGATAEKRIAPPHRFAAGTASHHYFALPEDRPFRGKDRSKGYIVGSPIDGDPAGSTSLFVIGCVAVGGSA